MKKTRNCLICGAPTVADNRLCKKSECLKEQLSRRLHITPPSNESKPSRSGVYISLTKCTHGIDLNKPCGRCEREWDAAQNETFLDSNPRIKI
jgi:hypothetical protein